MAWAKFDDRFLLNPKIMQAGLEGRALYVASILYCAGELTDGFVPSGVVKKLALLSDVEQGAEAVDRLVKLDLWEAVEGGYQIHDYLDYNPSSVQVKNDREQNAIRQNRWREKRIAGLVYKEWASSRERVSPRVFERDNYTCRYCGFKFEAISLTVDHVLPISRGGTNHIGNLATACRPCNSAKGARTPEEWL